jgi:hypothetical protein
MILRDEACITHMECVAGGVRVFVFADRVRSAAALRRLKDVAAPRHLKTFVALKNLRRAPDTSGRRRELVFPPLPCLRASLPPLLFFAVIPSSEEPAFSSRFLAGADLSFQVCAA